LRSISNLLALLIIIGLVVATSMFVAWALASVLGVFAPSASLSITGGTAFRDPSDPRTIYGEALAGVVGRGVTGITSVVVEYKNAKYIATCLNCKSIINEGYPPSGNDVIYIRFVFTSNVQPSVGDEMRVLVGYTVSQSQGTRYASGFIRILG